MNWGADDLRIAALLVALLLALLWTKIDRLGGRLQALLRLPGTLLHESAHFAVALATGGRPTGFSLVPRCEARHTLFGLRRSWVLGSVTIGNPGAVSAFPSGLAPLLLLPAAFFLYRRWFSWFPRDFAHALYLGVALFCCCGASIPSRRDVAVAFSRPAGLLLYGGIAAVAVFFRNDLLSLLGLLFS